MDNFGRFGRNYCKEVVVKDEDGKDVCIKLKYTALTPLLYRNYFATDMFDDLAQIAAKQIVKSEIVEKLEKNGVESLTEKEIAELEINDAILFFDRFAVALIATSVYPETYSYDRIRQTMLPEDFITDDRYDAVYKAIQELYMPALDDYKKKLMQAGARVAKPKN